MRRAIAILAAGFLGCAAASSDEMSRATQPPSLEASQGGDLASGCGAMLARGTPIALDEVHRGSGVAGREIAEAIEGPHTLGNVWWPWWSTEPSAADPLAPARVEIEPSAALDSGPYLQLSAIVRVKDAKGAVIIERPEAIFTVYGRDEAHASLDFEDAALAARLGLPPAANASQAADMFQLGLSWRRGKLDLALGSIRTATTCPLSQPKPEPPGLCEPGAGLLVMGEDAVTVPRGLRDKLAGSFAPIDAIAELRKQSALEVSWPEGTRSRLHVTYEPADHACVTAGTIHVHTSEHDAERAHGYKVVIPLHATLRTEDGRLFVRMPGFAETSVAREQPWDRHVDSALGFHEGSRLAPAERLGFSTPSGSLGFLSAWLRTPMTQSHAPQLTFTVCEPYPGAPTFPPVNESTSNRLSCFCATERRAEAPIRLGAP